MWNYDEHIISNVSKCNVSKSFVWKHLQYAGPSLWSQNQDRERENSLCFNNCGCFFSTDGPSYIYINLLTDSSKSLSYYLLLWVFKQSCTWSAKPHTMSWINKVLTVDIFKTWFQGILCEVETISKFSAGWETYTEQLLNLQELFTIQMVIFGELTKKQKQCPLWMLLKCVCIFLLQKMDKNRDGVVTLDEFILSCQEVFFIRSYSLDNHSTKFPTFHIYVLTIKPFHINFNKHKIFFRGLHCPLVVRIVH